MATPSHLSYVLRDLTELRTRRCPCAARPNQYFKRILAERRRHSRSERRQRVVAWLLGSG